MTPVLCTLVGSVVLACVAAFGGFRALRQTRPTYARRVYAATTFSVVLLLWPALFGCLVGFDLVAQLPLLVLSLLWPYALVSINLAHAHRARDDRVHPRAHVVSDMNSLSGAVFAIGGIVASQLGKQTAMCTSPIFSVALILCLGFVLPTPEIPDDYSFSVVVESLQQCMLHFAIALLLAGIIINLNVSICVGRKSATFLQDAIREALGARQ